MEAFFLAAPPMTRDAPTHQGEQPGFERPARWVVTKPWHLPRDHSQHILRHVLRVSVT
jgi:hypothetical protein